MDSQAELTDDQSTHNVAIAINDIQLLLAEKRTFLALIRTGMAVLALPLSLLSLLIATSKFYAVVEVRSVLIPLGILLLCLTGLGMYLVGHALRRMHHSDALIRTIKSKYGEISEYVD